jgi:hypothetical protein
MGVSSVTDGPRALVDYATQQLPRISQYGQGGPPETELPRGLVPMDFTQSDYNRNVSKGGHSYRASYFDFGGNATPIRPVVEVLRRRNLAVSPAVVSACAFTLLAGLTFATLWKRAPALASQPDAQAACWQLAMVAILIASPLTWTMNLVWLLPLPLLVWRGVVEATDRRTALLLAACGLGFFIAAAPDRFAFPWGWPPYRVTSIQYVVAEFVVFGSLLLHLRTRRLV